MNKMFLGLVLAVMAGITVVSYKSGFTNVQKENKHVPTEQRLLWFAKQAKNEGRRHIKIPSPINEYSGSVTTLSLDDALKISTVVIAELIEKRSYEQNSNNIVTWNKFRIDEVVSEAREMLCPDCENSTPPSEMLPLHSKEFLLSTSGGRLTVDGVEIEQIESGFPEFQEHAKYLLFLSLGTSGVAGTIGGPVGVFRLDNQGNALPINESSHLLKREFKEKYGNSSSRLRTRLR